ncbi:MAG TPA: hypothetical protein VF407_25425, partial [Polyangiaceae bacterium]
TMPYARTEIDAVPAPMRRLPLVAMLLAVAGVAIIAVFLDRFYLHSTQNAPSDSAEAIVPASATSPSEPVDPGEPSATESTSASPPITTELDDPNAIELPASTATPHPTHRRAPQHPPTAATSNAAALDCDPPYSVDDQGMRHYKKECFRR